jgi:hypothetical protein
MLNLLKGTVFNNLVLEPGHDLGEIAERAKREGLEVTNGTALPRSVTLVEGEWPGVKLTESGGIDRASAGPTGVPWVTSNGWKVRLASRLHPGTEIWLRVTAPRAGMPAGAYQVAVADASAHGGRWLVTLDDGLASGIGNKSERALAIWRKLTGAVDFFAAHKSWSEYFPRAVIGIISGFSGSNEFMSQEILNLVARTNQQYRILPKTGIAASSFKGLKAILYTDDQPPSPELRKQALEFVESGGMLITGPKWGKLPGQPTGGGEHPRYDLRILGKGRIAVARPDFEDPYLIANDSLVLISHRHELLRFWNGGAVGSYFTMRLDGKEGVVQILFYAGARFGKPTVRVAGIYRKAELWTLDHVGARSVEMEVGKDAVELHLPLASPYAALQLGI